MRSAAGLYAGDHWRAALEAYELAARYSSRAELWVISAGYGLIAASTLIKPYSATFARGMPDSVWRGPSDGHRMECLHEWWDALEHDTSLLELLPMRGEGALVIAAGSDYLTVLSGALEELLESDGARNRVSIVSAGTNQLPAALPVSGAFRRYVGGTDASLNARVLALLAHDAGFHRFQRSAMAATLSRIASELPPTDRRKGRTVDDEEVIRRITEMRHRVPEISRSLALRRLRTDGVACEHKRFQSMWDTLPPSSTRTNERP
jgi:hypothetical protein